MAKNRITDLKIGQYHEKKYCIDEKIGEKFAEISGDYNPIHLDADTAKKSLFKKKIVHGMLIGSYISGIIGNEFPGDGSIYMTQNLSFVKPIFYNEQITIRIEITNIVLEKKRIYLKTMCFNEQGDILVNGEALIKLDN